MEIYFRKREGNLLRCKRRFRICAEMWDTLSRSVRLRDDRRGTVDMKMLEFQPILHYSQTDIKNFSESKNGVLPMTLELFWLCCLEKVQQWQLMSRRENVFQEEVKLV